MRRGAPDGAGVSVHALTVRYGGLVALDDVGFTVAAGSICALVGRNGAGKSTCLRVLAGLLPLTAGDVAVLGTDPFGESFPKRDIGFLLDDQALFAYLTAAETLQLIASMYGLSATEREVRCADLLAFFDLDRNLNQLVDEYSTGMTRRLALAAAFIHAPKLLILDEPFETLDPVVVNRLKTLLTAFARGGGTVLLSTHLIGVVEAICDHVVILERGRVVLSGTIGEVVATVGRSDGATLESAYVAAINADEGPALQWMYVC
ncbi:MAG: ABC transporter ATP-binding protein [Gemmatimonadaceae bacterium]